MTIKAHNIGYGVVFNAPGGIKDDRTWITAAKENAKAFTDAIRAKPDHIMIQTWDPIPARILPESDSATMTGYLKWFIESTGRGQPTRE